jgi:hypothetical protein
LVNHEDAFLEGIGHGLFIEECTDLGVYRTHGFQVPISFRRESGHAFNRSSSGLGSGASCAHERGHRQIAGCVFVVCGTYLVPGRPEPLSVVLT